MNCSDHPDRMATAFCQSCGKPLCVQCARVADGLVLCEPCLLTRVAASSGFVPGEAPVDPAATTGYTPVSGIPPQPYRPPVPAGLPSPVLAGFLGLVPGVGAMYNGQFVKALLHVIIFVILVGACERYDFMGLLLAFWILYQVFDAAQTAAARRDGRALPDPFGILDMSHRIGPQSSTYPPTPVYQAPARPATQAAWTQNVQTAADQPPRQQEAQRQAEAAPYVAVPIPTPVPTPVPLPPSAPARRGEPIGAVVLIVVGLLFLLSTLGFLDFDWIGRGWPVLLMLLGVWLLIRRARAPIAPASGSFEDFRTTGTPVPPVSPSPASDPATAHNEEQQ